MTILRYFRKQRTTASGKVIPQETGIKPLSRKHLRAIMWQRHADLRANRILRLGHKPGRGGRFAAWFRKVQAEGENA